MGRVVRSTGVGGGLRPLGLIALLAPSACFRLPATTSIDAAAVERSRARAGSAPTTVAQARDDCHAAVASHQAELAAARAEGVDVTVMAVSVGLLGVAWTALGFAATTNDDLRIAPDLAFGTAMALDTWATISAGWIFGLQQSGRETAEGMTRIEGAIADEHATASHLQELCRPDDE